MMPEANPYRLGHPAQVSLDLAGGVANDATEKGAQAF
jgi:hypothetical protein